MTAALFIGGPADGTQRHVPNKLTTYEMAEIRGFSISEMLREADRGHAVPGRPRHVVYRRHHILDQCIFAPDDWTLEHIMTKLVRGYVADG